MITMKSQTVAELAIERMREISELARQHAGQKLDFSSLSAECGRLQAVLAAIDHKSSAFAKTYAADVAANRAEDSYPLTSAECTGELHCQCEGCEY